MRKSEANPSAEDNSVLMTVCDDYSDILDLEKI